MEDWRGLGASFGWAVGDVTGFDFLFPLRGREGRWPSIWPTHRESSALAALSTVAAKPTEKGSRRRGGLAWMAMSLG